MVWRRFLLAALTMGIIVVANLAPEALPFPVFSDKLNHVVAFAILTVAVVLAFPNARLFTLFLALAALNAAIEFAQGMLQVGREPDFQDWAAGALTVFAILAFVHFRRSTIR